MDINEFVETFMQKHKLLIASVGRKYLIPNRYNLDDIKQYISEKITHILRNRSNTGEPIKNPENYFKSCLDYYCIEYQRMNGFVFHLPKRPRKNSVEEEAQIRSYGFKYLDDITIEESNSLHVEYNKELETLDVEYNSEYSETWDAIVSILLPEEVHVLECIYMKNMTWNETSKYLGVAQSTCWFRKNRAMNKIYETCSTMTGSAVGYNLKSLLRGSSGALEHFRS